MRAGFLLFAAAFAGAQEIPPDQLLNQLLMKSDQTKVMGDFAGAVRGYREALEKVKSTPSLRTREEEVLQRLASAYIGWQHYPDAVRVSRQILAFHDKDCTPESPLLERCADAQYGLGLALMHAGEFAEAVKQLNASVTSFGKVNMVGDEHFHMTKMKQRGDVESLYAAALFRAGQKEKAIAMFRKAIATLKVVADDEKLDPGTRGSAKGSLKD